MRRVPTSTLHDEVVVLPPSEVDISTAELLAVSLRQACASGRARVVVDFSAVTFCDSSAVTVLLDAAESLRSRGCRLEVRNPNRFLERLAGLLSVSATLGLAPAS